MCCVLDDIEEGELVKSDPEIEKQLLRCLCEVALTLPATSQGLAAAVGRQLDKHILHITVTNLLQKFHTQQLIRYYF
ncbi:unnamed protein product [Timema podura]|uniref:Uncharacterized protein n=1 Tax=Timema podura TaxID=61482 RepID=A0ABN7PLF4_TIMPD|nr:unnamed protein product [Timema podura]